jgi:hypothetical protein
LLDEVNIADPAVAGCFQKLVRSIVIRILNRVHQPWVLDWLDEPKQRMPSKLSVVPPIKPARSRF